MKRYTFQIDNNLVYVFTRKGLEEAENKLSSDKFRLLTITKRMEVDGIKWR